MDRIAAGKKTRWIGPEAEPSSTLLRAVGVRVERPGAGAAAAHHWHKATVVLTPSALHLRSDTHKAKRVFYRLDDLYAATATTATTVAAYFAHAKRPGKDYRRDHDFAVVHFATAAEAAEWTRTLKWLAATGAVGDGDAPPRRRLLVLVNPYGGTKKGGKIWKETVCVPCFEIHHERKRERVSE